MPYGFQLLNQNLGDKGAHNAFLIDNKLSPTNVRAVRVTSIILDDTHPRFKELGEWNGLGIIEYVDVVNPQENSYSTARPLMGNIKKFPLKNEIVYLLSLPNTEIGNITSNTSDYYIDVISLWNHPHHNGYPSNPNILPSSQQKDYIQTELGDVRRVTDQSTEIDLGKTFIERSNIHPLLPFEGDILLEGRWGNSIRLGSTVKQTPNTWSNVGTNGDPIVIIRNGQGLQNEDGWVPIVEDINNDDSLIYLTSTQQIPLKSISKYNSYKNPPQAIDKYNGKQIILKSDRLVFNTKKDNILLSSEQTICLDSLKSINIETPSTIIQSNSVLLGDKEATEPILLGNKTVELFDSLIINLKSFMEICSTTVSTPEGTPLGPLNVVSSQMVTILEQLQVNLGKIKSKTSFTI